MTSPSTQQKLYAGDVSPADTWRALQDNATALLIDVRTPEEWAYVGIVDMTELGRECIFVPWLFYPRMNPNPDFVVQVQRAAKPNEDTPMYFICRSGQRSAYAAHAFTQLGFTACYNVAAGFEGDPNDDKHRGTVNGWKVEGLPWIQG